MSLSILAYSEWSATAGDVSVAPEATCGGSILNLVVYRIRTNRELGISGVLGLPKALVGAHFFLAPPFFLAGFRLYPFFAGIMCDMSAGGYKHNAGFRSKHASVLLRFVFYLKDPLRDCFATDIFIMPTPWA